MAITAADNKEGVRNQYLTEIPSDWRIVPVGDLVFSVSPDATKFIAPEGVKVFDNVEKTSIPVGQPAIRRYSSIFIEETEFHLLRDTWGFFLLEKRTLEVAEEELIDVKDTVQNVTKIWKLATNLSLGDENYFSSLGEMFGVDAIRLVRSILSVYQEHPSLLQDYWYAHVDPHIIADNATSPDEAVQKLQLPESTDYDFGPSSATKNSETFNYLQNIVRSLASGGELDAVQKMFISAMKVAKIIHSPNRGIESTVNSLTERYAVARVLENRLVKELVGFDIFEQHQDRYDSVAIKLRGEKVEVPQEFKPYDSGEFSWSLGVNRTCANAGGQFFLSDSLSREDVSRILDHERIHRVTGKLKDVGRTKAYKIENLGRELAREEYDEIFTESCAKLIQSGGDIDEAIRLNEESSVAYWTGVREFLTILKHLSAVTGKSAIAFVMDGMWALRNGKTYSASSEIASSYDTVEGLGSFEKRMQKYQDKKMLKYSGNLSGEQKKEVFATPLTDSFLLEFSRMSHEDVLRIIGKGTHIDDLDLFQRYFKQDIEGLIKAKNAFFHPRALTLTLRIFEILMRDEERREEMRLWINQKMKVDNTDALETTYSSYLQS